MPAIRTRISDHLLRTGIENALDRAALEQGLAAVPGNRQGHAMATGAVAFAGWYGDALLWLSWRLRPRTMPE